MTQDDLKNLQVGDLVRHAAFHGVYVVTGNYGGRVTAVRTVDLTNPSEWERAKKPDACPMCKSYADNQFGEYTERCKCDSLPGVWHHHQSGQGFTSIECMK